MDAFKGYCYWKVVSFFKHLGILSCWPLRSASWAPFERYSMNNQNLSPRATLKVTFCKGRWPQIKKSRKLTKFRIQFYIRRKMGWFDFQKKSSLVSIWTSPCINIFGLRHVLTKQWSQFFGCKVHRKNIIIR